MATFLAASMFIQTLYVLADLYWIGWLGNEAIAAVASPAGIASILMLLLMMIVQFAGGGLIRAFSRDPAVITFGSDYFKIVSFNFVAVELVFISSSVFQGIGNALPPLVSSMTRLLLFALPATLLSQRPGFQIRYVWYLSVLSIFFQACVNLVLLQREFRRKLTFRETPDLTAAAGAASVG